MRRYFIFFFILILIPTESFSQWNSGKAPGRGYKQRIVNYVDSIRIIDTHEHLLDPEKMKKAGFNDFSLFFLENGFHDLVSSGMPDSVFPMLFGSTLNPSAKWKIIEPYWNRSYNTASNRIILKAARDLYGIDKFDSSSVVILSEKIKKNAEGDWFDNVLHDRCKIDYIIQDGGKIAAGNGFVKLAHRFNPWLMIRRKGTIDSLSFYQTESISSLDAFVRSMWNEASKASIEGMMVIKINIAYYRSLSFEKVDVETANKIFKKIINGDEKIEIHEKEAKPLQDYMIYKLLGMAEQLKVPVAFHTGLQSGNGNYIENSNPTLLTNIFKDFPRVNFVLFHGSYPYGGELSTLAKSFSNVYIDMNWIWSISPAWSARYLNDWLETVPVSKIMAFGGDERIPELTYASLLVARKVISDVMVARVRSGYFTEDEAKKAVKMMLHDNGTRFYNLPE